MPHISLPDGLPGITSAFAFRPETAKPMRELAEVLLRGPNTLTSGGAMAGVTEVAVVARRDEGGDGLALGARQRVRAAEQHFGELAHRPRRLGPEGERTDDPREAFGQADVRHRWVECRSARGARQ